MNRKALIYLTLLIIGVCIQFILSSQPYGQQDIRDDLKNYVNLDRVEDRIGNLSFQYVDKEVSVENDGVEGVLEFFIRKAGHFFGFMTLGFLAFQTFRYSTTLQVAVPWSLLVSLLLAVLDEWHQSFTPDRSSLVSDVLLDFSGALFAILLMILFLVWVNKKQRLI
ncbi:VanZ family protein [Brevibacillus daliensis]|uniref:VanZ family protein n=1 Tax=Brevibacillus daliensis TaxID=2892995 RepID=UPI001E2D79BF|nr:VanZ family protein [Brevibacillus daliensis]